MSQQINLFNPLFLRKEKYFSARTMLQSLGLILLGLVALYAYALVQTSELRRIAADQSRQLAAQRDQLVKLGGRTSSKLLAAEVGRLEAQARARRAMLETLQGGELGDTEGFSRYFSAFARHRVQGVWLTGFTVGESGDMLRIRGRVLHPDLVPAFLKVLNNADVMRGRLVTELKLVAHDETGTARAASGPGDPGPARFVEFDLAAPLRNPAAPAAKGGAR